MQITNLPQIPGIFMMPSAAETGSTPLLRSDDGALFNLSSLNALADSLMLSQQQPLLAQVSESVRELLASVVRLDAMFLTSSSYDATKSNQLFALSDLTAAFADRYRSSYAQSVMANGLSDLSRSQFGIVELVLSKVSEFRSPVVEQRVEDGGMLKNNVLQPPVVSHNPAVPTASELSRRLQSAATPAKQQSGETRRHELEHSKKKQNEAKKGGFFEGLRALLRKIFKAE